MEGTLQNIRELRHGISGESLDSYKEPGMMVCMLVGVLHSSSPAGSNPQGHLSFSAVMGTDQQVLWPNFVI